MSKVFPELRNGDDTRRERQPTMDADEETVEMALLQEQSFGEYRGLLQLMDNRQLAAFKSLVHRALKKEPPAIDLDHVMAHPVSMSFLDKAASENLADFVEFLLEVGAEPNRANPEHDRAPIHFAAERGNVEALAALTRHQAINPNLLAGQMTALHYAVKADCEMCVRLLLDAGASPNIPNSKGVTALHSAAERNSRNMVQIILDHSKILDLDTYRDRRKETARSLIEQKFPDIQLPAESEKPDTATLLRYYLTANDEGNFLKKLAELKEFEGPESLAELLRLSVERNLSAATDALLSREGAENVSLWALAKLAVERAHPELLEKLLARSPGMASRLLLPASQELGSPGGSARDRLKCLHLVLDQPEVDVRQEDDKGNGALHYAARAECWEAVRRLLRLGCYIGHANSFGAPPLAHIAAGVLEEHLDACLSSTNERTEEYEIVMDYRNLVPHDTECGAVEDRFERRRRSSRARPGLCSETEALLYVAESKSLRHLLKHPLLASFLYLKYLRIRHVLYVNFLLYFVFYCLLVAYIYVITSDAPEPQAGADNASDATASAESLEDRWQSHPVLSALVALSLTYLVVRESLQLLSGPVGYLLNPENWLELGLVGMTLALLLGAGREIGALAILLSTWELVILMSQHPRMATDIEMFKTVTVNFTKFLFLYVFLILAFAWAFYVLFKGDDNFPHPLGSLFKTIVMLTGEFDSGELQFGLYPVLSRLVFIGFIFLIVIILLNLLNGLAVNDTAEILSEAELVTLVSRARLVAYAERMVVGGPLSPSSIGLGCCLEPAPSASRLGGLARAPVRFVARRILLFPRYLPHARISVKPLKSYEITLHGRARTGNRCSSLTMDPVLAQRAKQVLADRDQKGAEDKVMEHLDTMEARFDALEAAIRQVALSLAALRPRPASTEDRSTEPSFYSPT
ncbi:transient receptor potential cation channel protein painless isoform X2 [Phymastichus coffea]|uniref:transient receptor potential cation channel protein painless isoform X2 n=1 Tax=Phymastichus coffea TaxID=108790 RepID=UPI00273B058A|nr:transient receptor potential cation channel protein painless isoform X2 [Phymastichus coffea]